MKDLNGVVLRVNDKVYFTTYSSHYIKIGSIVKFDNGNGRKIIGDNGYFLISHHDKIIATYGSKKFTLLKQKISSSRLLREKRNILRKRLRAKAKIF